MAHETGHMAGGHLARSGEGEKQALATYLLTHRPRHPGRRRRRAGRGRRADLQRRLFRRPDRRRLHPHPGVLGRPGGGDLSGEGRPIGARASSISSTTSATRRCSPTPSATVLHGPPADRRPDRGPAGAGQAAAALRRRRQPRGDRAPPDHDGQAQGLHEPAATRPCTTIPRPTPASRPATPAPSPTTATCETDKALKADRRPDRRAARTTPISTS